MAQDTAGPEGVAKALASAKAALADANKKFPSPSVHPDASKASYQLATDARKTAGESSKTIPAGDTSGQELKQAEENAERLKEAAKP
jgi:hypothetical protein